MVFISGFAWTTLVGIDRFPRVLALNPQGLGTVQPMLIGNEPTDYHVWKVFPEDQNGFTIIIVSVAPRHFNRGDMIDLAKRLDEGFPDRPKLKAGLLDNESIVKLFSTGQADLTTYYSSERGRYYLDRVACRQYVEFSSERGKPKKIVNLPCARR